MRNMTNPMAAFDEIAAEIMKKSGCTPEILTGIAELRKLFEEAPKQDGGRKINVLTVKETLKDGSTVYIPVTGGGGTPTGVESFTMTASSNLIEMQDECSGLMSMLRSAGEKPYIMAVSEDTYAELEKQLAELVQRVYDLVDEAINAEPLNEANALMGRTTITGDAEVDKACVEASILRDLFSGNPVSGAALTEDEEIVQVTKDDIEKPEPCCGCCGGCDCSEDEDTECYGDCDDCEADPDDCGHCPDEDECDPPYNSCGDRCERYDDGDCPLC